MVRRYATWGMLVPAALFLITLGLMLRPQAPRAASRAPGDMGILVADLTPEARRAAGVPGGVLVLEVQSGGPADKKGIQEGDIITQYEHEPVRSAAEFLGRIRRDGEGFLAWITIRRDGGERPIGFVTLAAQPAPPPRAEEIEARFTQLEGEMDALKARVETLEKSRAIPRRQVITH